MFSEPVLVIAGTAATIGFVHTLLGPDHYLPFIVMSRARKWSLGKTLFISFLCGLGHVLSSILLGFLGLALGVTLFRLEGVESFRGGLASWLLIAFGLAYFIWGLRRAIKNRPHSHIHVHKDGSHEHEHAHNLEHSHVHEGKKSTNLTPWILFTIFVFGPCEPLIPLIMFPAAKHNTAGVVLVAATFAVVTILTMLAVITLGFFGVSFIKLGKMERYVHALAGAMIFISGISVQFLGL